MFTDRRGFFSFNCLLTEEISSTIFSNIK